MYNLRTQVNSGSVRDEISDTLVEMCQKYISNESIYLLDNCSSTEATAISFVYDIASKNGRSQCVVNGMQFFCDAITFLCEDFTFSNMSSSLLSEKCVQIRDNQCGAEWRIVENFFNLSLPDCDKFDSGISITYASDIPNLQCPDKFREFCGSVCLPVCGEPLAGDVVDVFKISIVVFYIISLTGGVITLIVSIIKRKTM